ncbi:DegT/DnrJ/EryC1/StrS family aminotransferase [candidate division KSB1 bacterium]|nr:DegT/DnrJ/EryC1/StrS family aminotransferase [candidate division KSB1 bacterium]
MSAPIKLAIEGGTPVRTQPMPPRALIGEEEKAAVMKMFDEAIQTGNAFGYGGTYEQQYEKDFVDFMGGGFADAVNSGTNAVFCALGGLQLDAFSEVIIPPITDPGGVMPVIFAGCVPVMADADPRSFNTSDEQIAPLLTERTRAIIIAHIAGEPADMDPIMALAKKRHLFVIEDCAQAHGATYKGKLLGTFGDFSAFSTMFGKHHCTGGQGGVVYTQNESLHWQARRFADRGKPFNLDAPGNVIAGLNCNLNDLSAAIGSSQLKKLPKIIAKRRFIGNAVKAGLASRKAVSVGWQVPDTEPVYWFLRIKLELDRIKTDKETFCKALSAEGIPAAPSYRHIPAEAPWFKNKATFGKSGFPWNCSDYHGPRTPVYRAENAIEAAETHFMIPIHENFGQQEVDDILSAIKKVETAYLK